MVTNLAEFKTKKAERNFKNRVFNESKKNIESTYHEHDISLSIEASLRKDGTFNEYDWHVTGNNNRMEAFVLLYATSQLLKKDLINTLGEDEFKKQWLNIMNNWFKKQK
jgi:hypothetical protein